MPIAYSYKRFSSAAQEGNDSIRRQTAAAIAYIEDNPQLGLVLDTTLSMTDAGVSAFKGTNLKTGALSVFTGAVKAGMIPEGSYLLLESLDRFTRQQVNVAALDLLSLINSGVVVVTLHNQTVYREEQFQGTDGLVNLLGALIAMDGHHREQVTKGKRIAAAWAAKFQKVGDGHILTSVCC
jgi:DNA invertase Pin-like site-specific DNA recombinase